MAFISLGDIELCSGKTLKDVEVAYETYGQLNFRGDNAVIICHALTGDHFPGRKNEVKGWWETIVGPDKAIDTNRYYVLCSNMLGGCYGTTGPSSVDPATGAPYGMKFPLIQFKDAVKAQVLLAKKLGVKSLKAVIGGSMGGMQALEWGVQEEIPIGKLIVLAAPPKSSSFVIAFHEIQRQSIMLDPLWRGGDYYGGEIPAAGLSVARMIGVLSYRSDTSLAEKFGRKFACRIGNAENPYEDFNERFDVQSYMNYQGRALVHRFDPNSYLYITKAVDLFDIGRGFESLEDAVGKLQGHLCCVAIDSDLLFPPAQVKVLADIRKRIGLPAEYFEIKSSHGHDAFLIESDQLDPIMRKWMETDK